MKRKKHPKKLRIMPFINLAFLALVIVATLVLYQVLFVQKKAEFISLPLPIAQKISVPQTAFVGVSTYDQDYRQIDALQKETNIHFAIVGSYVAWGAQNNSFNSDWASAVWQSGSVPLITWEPWKPIEGFQRVDNSVDQPQYRLARIAQGAFDTYITQFAKDVKAYRQPIMIRFAHEMNGNWYSWGSTLNTPKEYIAAWRHVHDVFSSLGATNVSWVWSPNEVYEDPAVPNASNLEAFYPGGDYVDWVGFSSFNWAGRYKNNVWRDPEELYTPTVEVLKSFNKPILIAETASADASGSARKAQWIFDLSRYVQTNKDIKGVVWFNVEDTGINWKLDSTPLSQQAFTNSFNTYFLQKVK